MRIDLFNTRIENDMKTFIYNHINKNNNIITDGWVLTIFWIYA